VAGSSRITFLFDVDNTLLDHDRVVQDYHRHLGNVFGVERQSRYWECFEELRAELGYADYLGALQRYRAERPWDAGFLEASNFLIEYPFANRLFPGSLDAVEHVSSMGRAAILTDGDVVFQPRKIRRSGLFEAVEGNVLIYIHKEFELADVEHRYPSEHFVLIDDKLRILTAVKKTWGERVTTVFVRQGHYAFDPGIEQYPSADITLESIASVATVEISRFLGKTC